MITKEKNEKGVLRMRKIDVIMTDVVNYLKLNFITEYSGVYEDDEEAKKDIPIRFKNENEFRIGIQSLLSESLFTELETCLLREAEGDCI